MRVQSHVPFELARSPILMVGAVSTPRLADPRSAQHSESLATPKPQSTYGFSLKDILVARRRVSRLSMYSRLSCICTEHTSVEFAGSRLFPSARLGIGTLRPRPRKPRKEGTIRRKSPKLPP